MPVHNTKYNYTREEDSVAFSVLEFINKMLPSKSSVSDILKEIDKENILNRHDLSGHIRDIRKGDRQISYELRDIIQKLIEHYTQEGIFCPEKYLKNTYSVLDLEHNIKAEETLNFVQLYANKLGLKILNASENSHLLGQDLIIFRESMVYASHFVIGSANISRIPKDNTISCHIKITSDQFGTNCHEEYQNGLVCSNNGTLTLICESDDHKGTASFKNAIFKWNVHPMGEASKKGMSLSGNMSAETKNKKGDFAFVMVSKTPEFQEMFDLEKYAGKTLTFEKLPEDVKTCLRGHTSFRSFHNNVSVEAA